MATRTRQLVRSQTLGMGIALILSNEYNNLEGRRAMTEYLKLIRKESETPTAEVKPINFGYALKLELTPKQPTKAERKEEE